MVTRSEIIKQRNAGSIPEIPTILVKTKNNQKKKRKTQQ